MAFSCGRRGVYVLATLLAAAMASAQPQSEPSTGSIEFLARVTPTGGRAEAVLRMPFYLLRKSFSKIEEEAEGEFPPPELERFVAGLEISPELKAWMKRTRSVRLGGAEFARRVSVNDIFEVPEFFQAYLSRNAQDVAVGFPRPRYREKDRESNPRKYEKQKREYLDEVRRYLEMNPHSRDGMDLSLADIDPWAKWSRQEQQRPQKILQRALELAHTRYLAAKTESDLEGRAGFIQVPAGEYWLSTLERDAVAGDVRVRWDLPVVVRPGQVTRLELSNFNAAPRNRSPR